MYQFSLDWFIKMFNLSIDRADDKDSKDSSGVRLYHSAPKGTEYGMFAPGPAMFSIPAGAKQVVTGTCNIKKKLTLFAGMPHMHETGTEFHSTIVRKDGSTEELISVTGWQFEMQPFYHFPVTLEPGDKLLTKCTFHNKTKDTVNFGTGTGDEMCFNFAYATPPPDSPYCDDLEVDPNADVPYKAGKCVGDAPIAAPEKVTTPVKFAAAPEATGGTMVDGRYKLMSATLYLPDFVKAYMNPDSSFVAARGQALVKGERIHWDVTARVVVKTKGGQGTDTTQLASVSGKVKPGADKGKATLEPDCGATDPVAFRYAVGKAKSGADTLTVLLDQKVQQFTVPAVYVFEKAGK